MSLLDQLNQQLKPAAPVAPAPPVATATAPVPPVAEAPAAPAAVATTAPPAPPAFVMPVAQTAPVDPQNVTAFHHNVSTADLGDDSIATGEFSAYKGRKDYTDRLAILNAKKLTFARVHYIEGAGYYICNSSFKTVAGVETVSQLAPCCERLEPPKKRFGLLVLQYPTDQRGNVQGAAFNTPGMVPYTLKVWRLGEPLFDQLRTTHRNFSLDDHDVLVTCTDADYQRMNIAPCPESLLKQPFFQPHLQSILAFIQSMLPKLEKIVGTRATQKEWAEVLAKAAMQTGAPVPGIPGSSPIDVPATDLATLLGNVGKS